MNLRKEFEKILINESYYLPIRRSKNISYKNYYVKPKDPDGKIRLLKNEKKTKIKQYKFILNFLKNEQTGGTILDIGCGYGWMLSTLNKKKWETHGVEINRECFENAKKNTFKFYDKLSKVKKKFDYITMIHVIEHLKNPIYYLNKVKKLLKKNGVLIIETPDFDSAMARRYNLKFRLLHDPTHISLFSLESIIRLLRDKKFKILKFDFPYFDGPFFNKKNLDKILKKKIKGYSPPFYGSVMTIICKKK